MKAPVAFPNIYSLLELLPSQAGEGGRWDFGHPASEVSPAARLWLAGGGERMRPSSAIIIWRTARPFGAAGLAGRDLHQLLGPAEESPRCLQAWQQQERFVTGNESGNKWIDDQDSREVQAGGGSVIKPLWISCRVSSVLDRAGGFYFNPSLIKLLLMFSTGTLQWPEVLTQPPSR